MKKLLFPHIVLGTTLLVRYITPIREKNVNLTWTDEKLLLCETVDYGLFCRTEVISEIPRSIYTFNIIYHDFFRTRYTVDPGWLPGKVDPKCEEF
jgi:hypothetical protein